MLVYISLTAAVLLLAAFVKNSEYAVGRIYGGQRYGVDRQQAINITAAVGIDLLLTGVSACRIAVGNDYWVYRENFKLIYMGREVASEAGFNFIVYWMQKLLGYNNYLPIFAVFSVITVAFMVKAVYDQGEWFWGVIFLLMTNGYYFQSLNTVRYYLVIAMVLYAAKFVIRKEYGKFVTWILIASLFHKSVLLVIPGYIVLRLLCDIKLNKWLVGAGSLIVLSMIFMQDFYRSIIFRFYPYYENTAFDNGEVSVINILRCLGCLILALMCYRDAIRDRKHMQFYFWANIAGLVINTFGSFIPEVTRVANYFCIFQIFLVSGCLFHLKKGIWKNLLTFGTLAVFTVYFAFFLKTAYDVNIRLLPYLNWIFN